MTCQSHQSADVQLASPTPAAASEVLRACGVHDVETPGDGVVRGALGEISPTEIRPALVAAGVAFIELRVLRPALEDLFVELTGSGFDVAG